MSTFRSPKVPPRREVAGHKGPAGRPQAAQDVGDAHGGGALLRRHDPAHVALPGHDVHGGDAGPGRGGEEVEKSDNTSNTSDRDRARRSWRRCWT